MRLEAAGSGAVELSVDAAKPVENSGAASAAPAPTAKATPAWVGFAYGVFLLRVLSVTLHAAFALAWLRDSDARAGAVLLGVVLVHSLVDYPLRTAALAMLAALGAVLLDRAAGAPAAEPERDPEPAQGGLRVSL